MSGAHHACLSAGRNGSCLGATVKPVGHIGDEAGDLGHGIGLFERPVNNFHDFVIITCEPVIADPVAFI